MKTTLSAKDQTFREFSLNGPVWQVVLYVSLPLALYQSLNQLFKILDSMIAAHISPSAVSAVAYLSQINTMFSALGGGLAMGASIKISEAYGAGDMKLVKQRVSTMFALCGALGAGLLLLLVPNTTRFLRFMNTPEEFIREGASYFILELFSLVIIFLNNVYIAVERARGNSRRILGLNLAVILVKLGLTAWFVYGLHGGIQMISTATILSQSFLFLAAVINMRGKDSAFGFSLKAVSFKNEVAMPMISLSIPVVVQKIGFSLGKVLVNSMSTVYGSLTVGALGISNSIGGITTVPQDGFQEGSAAIISQNLGGRKPERAIKTFWWTLGINMIIGAVFMGICLLSLGPLTRFFAGDDQEFAGMIGAIYRYEAMGAIPLGINAAVMGLLYGFGKTRLTLFINICRLFVFRIPVLWALQRFTGLGADSLGIAMAVSNICSGILAAVVAAAQLAAGHILKSRPCN